MTQAIILANQRSGGTWLATCLSNHPDIHCERGEITHHHHIWYRLANLDKLTMLKMALNQHFYKVCACRLTYGHAFFEPLRSYLLEIQPRVIWLQRANWLRVTVSNIALKKVRRSHTDAPLPLYRFAIKPSTLIKMLGMVERREAWAIAETQNLTHVLPVTYREITGGQVDAPALDEQTGRRICDFLGVDYVTMPGTLRRINPAPLSDIIINYEEVQAALLASPYARFLADEMEGA